MTEFAVAPQSYVSRLKAIKGGGYFTSADGPGAQIIRRKWAVFYQGWHRLTDAGKLALELREALGPDRGLTKAGAKALVHDGPTQATKIRLMDDGLWKRGYARNSEPLAWLTEDGRRVREILLKYRAEV